MSDICMFMGTQNQGCTGLQRGCAPATRSEMGTPAQRSAREPADTAAMGAPPSAASTSAVSRTVNGNCACAMHSHSL